MATVNNGNSKLKRLQNLRVQSRIGGGSKRVKQQHDKGKFTARERINTLLDPGTFHEIDPFVTQRSTDFDMADRTVIGDAVVTGYGKVEGRTVFVYAQDFTVFGGSVSEVVGQKICKIFDLAMKTGAPVVGLNDSGGARIQEGVFSLAAYGDIFLRNTLASGVIPQISVILGPSAGGAVYSPAITDFIFMVRDISQMYITGPDVVKAVTGQEVTHEALGGADTHSKHSGVSHFVFDTEAECLLQVRRLLSFLPSNNVDDPPITETVDTANRTDDSLIHTIPEEPSKPYDIRSIIVSVLDDGDFMEVHQSFAQNIVVGFGKLMGRTIGLVGNQPDRLAGVLDIDASVKAARFVRFCDCFNIPIVTFVDVPGFMPGTDQEYGGIIKHGAKLIYAYAEATVPKISVLLRKAYGGAYIVMCSKHLRGDINLAWPSGEIAVMGPEGAVNIVFRDQIAKADQPATELANLVLEYRDKFANPYLAASRGYLDDIINPEETRPKIIQALEMLQNKRDGLPPKKHGNIPL